MSKYKINRNFPQNFNDPNNVISLSSNQTIIDQKSIEKVQELINTDSFEDADKIIDSFFCRNFPEYFRICLMYCELHFKKGDYKRCIDYFNIVLHIKPSQISHPVFDKILIILNALCSTNRRNFAPDLEKIVNHLNTFIKTGADDRFTLCLFKFFNYIKLDSESGKRVLLESNNKIIQTMADVFINYDLADKIIEKIGIDAFYKEYTQKLIDSINKVREIKKSGQIIAIPADFLSVLLGHFYLSYYGKNNCEIFQLTAQYYSEVYQGILYTGPLKTLPRDSNRKIRVGYISYFYKSMHSVLRDRTGIIINSPKDKFDVFTIFLSKPEDHFANVLFSNSPNPVIFPGLKYDETCQKIVDLKLDILIYSDVGMCPFTYFLALSRLAPIQMNTWGHSDTSGISTIDYYLSSKFFELDNDNDAQSHYSEKLVKLNELSTYYYRPISDNVFDLLLKKQDLGLPLDKKIIFCGHSVFKFKKDFIKSVIVPILSNNSGAVIVFINDSGKEMSEYLRSVLFNIIPPNLQNMCIFINRQSLIPFQSVIYNSDIVLDTHPFGSFNLSCECINLGKPMIAMPSDFINGRFTCGLYKKLGIDHELIVNSYSEYVNKVNLLLQNEKKYNEISKFIFDNKMKVLENSDNISDWYNKLIEIFHSHKPK